MVNIHLALLFSLFTLNMNGGGFRFFDDETISFLIFLIVLLHIASIVAYFARLSWLRILCGILYLPLFLVPLFVALFDPMGMLIFIPLLTFYYFVIGKKRT